MFALYFVTHCQLYSCRVFSDITSTWHKYFILGIFLSTFHCVEMKMDQNDSIVSCPWLLCADTAASKWQQKARKSVYEIINSCLLYLSQSMRYLTSAYLRCPRKLIRYGSILQIVCGLSLNFKYPPTEKNLSIGQLSTKRSVCLHFYS